MAFAPPVALEHLRRAHAEGRLGHAYLLVGARAAGELATQLADLVVGARPGALQAHPDVHVVEPESKSRRIVVEQVRVLESSLRLRASVVGGRKVGILREADRLLPQASNAFLKTLEEPPAESLLLLVSEQPESLMDTILSRCIKVTLHDTGEGDQARSVEEAGLLDLLARESDRAGALGGASIPVAYRLLREFNALLSSVRNRLQNEADTAFEREEKQYAQTTDGSWLGEREAYYKSITEARYVAQRGQLLAVIARWWADALRQASGGIETDRAAVTTDILRRLAAIDALRENLDRNIQEALALEVAFVQIFGM